MLRAILLVYMLRPFGGPRVHVRGDFVICARKLTMCYTTEVAKVYMQKQKKKPKKLVRCDNAEAQLMYNIART